MNLSYFMMPIHPPGKDYHLTLEEDAEAIVLADSLGFDEAWVGEHHSAGWETIASPEIFMGVAADRTKHIMLGSGVLIVATWFSGIFAP